MTAPHDLDAQLDAFLLDGPTRLPDASFDAVRDRTEQTRQRVVLGPWRFPEMNKLLAVGVGAAAVIAVLVVGPNLLPSSSSGPGAPPAASAPPSDPAPSAAPSDAPATAEPDASPAAGLPEGAFVVSDRTSPAHPVTVTIPGRGWSHLPDFDGLLKGEDGDPPQAAMLFWSWQAGTTFDVFGDPCQWESTRPETPSSTPAEIADALAAQASRDASKPVDVTIDGHGGKYITLHVPDDAPTREEAFKDCDGGEFASYAVTGEPGVDGLSRTHQGPGQVDELWILDVDGQIVIIDAMHRPDTPEGLVEEMRTIAESTTFDAE